MSLVIPNTIELAALQLMVNQALTLRLYGNDVTPSGTSSVASFTEIAGGGYAAKALVGAGWSYQTTTEPSSAVHAAQTWNFTGVIDAPGSIYGYYITKNSDGTLLLAERFPAANVPFAPEAGSRIIVLPRVTAESQF